GKPAEAFATLEQSLARGLLDDLAIRHRLLSPAEQRQRDELTRQLNLLDGQVFALLASRDDKSRGRIGEVRERRDKAQRALRELEASLAAKYGPAAGQVYDTAAIQRRLPEDTALVVWVDLLPTSGRETARGDRWACVLRARGAPAWARLRGSGP